MLATQDVLLCRSTLTINPTLLIQHNLKYLATASSGSDHIDCTALRQAHITLIDAKGCNAHAVTDYVTASIAYLQLHQQLPIKKIGIIGVGAVGSLVKKRLEFLDFETVAYDPIKNYQDNNFTSAPLEALYSCDVLCLHANLHDSLPEPSRHLINESFLKQLKPGTIIINAARGELVDEQALLKYQNNIIYCTDVYRGEPDHINPKLVSMAALCTPHIAGHSIEGKLQAVKIVSEKLHAHFDLPPPPWIKPPVNSIVTIHKRQWQEFVLKLYNPINETLKLKANLGTLKSNFLSLRKQHLRNDFIWID